MATFDIAKLKQTLQTESAGNNLPSVLSKSLPATQRVRDISTQRTSPLPAPKTTVTNKVVNFITPGRGFSDDEINEAKPGLKDIAVGTAKSVGEIGVGLSSLASMGLRKLPVLNKLAGSKEQLDRYNKALEPTTAGQAKVMRVGDIAGAIAPIGLTAKAGNLSKIDKLAEIESLAKNSIKNAPNNGVRDTSLDFLRKNPSEISKGEVRLRELEDGTIFIEDGRHRLGVGIEKGVSPRIVDVTAEYTGNPSAKITALKSQLDALPDVKERGFIKSAKKVLPDASKIAGQYVPRSTDELSMKARNLIKDNPAQALTLAREGSDEVAVAVASELLKKYADDAARTTDKLEQLRLYDEAASIANAIAPKLTEQGRAIQAASILGRLTPEGQIRFAAQEVQRYNRANPTKAIPELGAEDAQKIADSMREIQKMPDGEAKAIKFNELQKFVNALVPTPLWKKVTTVWKAGLLTGIKTTGLNLFSNLSHGLSEVAKDAPAAVVDSVASLFTGKRTKTLTLRTAFAGIKEGTIKGTRYFATGFDERNVGTKLDYNRISFGKGTVAKAFEVYTDTVFKVLGATDQPFYYAALSRSLMDQALANGKNLGLKGKELVEHAYKVVENPTEEMLRYGTADATTAVFQNQTKLGEVAGTIQNIPGIGQIILPFARTPSSVAMQIIAYSPIGAVKTLFENVGKGKFDQRLFSQGLGRSTVGTAFLALGYQLASNGLVSDSFPKGDEREQELQKAEGSKANAIKINGKWRSPMVLGPIGNIIMMGAFFQKAVAENGSPSEAAMIAATGVWKSFLEQTFLTGVSNFAEVLQDPSRHAGTYLPNLISSFVPTLVSDVARSIDPLERKTASGMSVQTVKQRVQARLPGLRQGLEPDIDVLGRERQSVGNPLEILADPTRPAPQIRSLVTDELRRLMDMDYRVSPSKAGDKNGYPNLTQAQNTQLWKRNGEIVNGKLNNLFSSEKYMRLQDDQKAEVVEDFVKKSQTYARAEMVLSLTQGLSGEELRSKLSEVKESGLMSRDVYTAWTELR